MNGEIIRQMDLIFKPGSIAVIGASNAVVKWGYRMVHYPLNNGYRGAIYPVNSTEKEILGLPAFKKISDIPGKVDLAVITVPAASVPQALIECAEKGIKAVVTISAGFAETGKQGKVLEDEISRIVRENGIRSVGPNCMGIFSSAVNLSLAFEFAPKKGRISFVSQSGTYGAMLAQIASDKGYGISKFVSIGNQADLKATDYLEYLAEDEDTGAIGFYIEGFKDGRRFFETAREVVKKKPIIIYKAGRTAAATRAAISHTASIAGSDEVFDAMCKQVGIIRAYETSHIFDMAEALVSLPLPKGNRVGIIGSGGQGVVTSDVCETLGMKVPEFDEETKIRLKKELPPQASIPSNPVDFAGGVRGSQEDAMMADALARIDYIDGVICPMPYFRPAREQLPDMARLAIQGAEILSSIPQKYGKPVIMLRWHKTGDIAQQIVTNANIPAYDTPEQTALAMYALVEYSRVKKRLADEG